MTTRVYGYGDACLTEEHRQLYIFRGNVLSCLYRSKLRINLYLNVNVGLYYRHPSQAH